MFFGRARMQACTALRSHVRVVVIVVMGDMTSARKGTHNLIT